VVEQLRLLLDSLGIDWVLWLLLGLSVVSIAVMIERFLFFRRESVTIKILTAALQEALASDDPRAHAERIRAMGSMESWVLAHALDEIRRGPDALEDIIGSQVALQRERFDRGLVFLGTLGSNAPFIGLFGTVLGIIDAFASLQSGFASADGSQNSAIMGSISEALVATAIGLLVAIPAVVAFNMFKRGIRRRVDNTESLARLLLAHVKTPPGVN